MSSTNRHIIRARTSLVLTAFDRYNFDTGSIRIPRGLTCDGVETLDCHLTRITLKVGVEYALLVPTFAKANKTQRCHSE
jgi:hypothetical protein